jgi:DnaJ-class molecular chaperone
MGQGDYYQMLEVDRNATPQTIKEAYRKLAFQYHPDKNKDNPAATEKMKEINEAYAILSNPVKRREYNALRERYGDLAYEHFRQTHSSEDIFRGSDINKIFDDLARMYGFRSADEIFSQFYGPGYRTFEFRRSGLFDRGFVFYQAPGQQHGTGDKTIYGSQAPSPQIPFSGILGALIKLFLQKVLGIQFPEKGKDWKDVITLSPKQVEKGNEVEYIHKKYDKPKKLMVKIPPGVKSGQRIRLKGMGAPGRGGGESGDMYLEVRIKVPLSKKIKGIFK